TRSSFLICSGRGPSSSIFCPTISGRRYLPGCSDTLGSKNKKQRGRIPAVHDYQSTTLLKINRLIVPVLVELRAPYFVHGLVLRSTKAHRRSEPEIKAAEIFERFYQPFGVELRSIPLQRRYQDVGCDVTLQRYIVRRLAREVFCQRRFVIEDE